jgi:phosphatidate cytidylyltransferase
MSEAFPTPKPSDLKVRTLSAIVMVAVAGAALWLGAMWFKLFVLAIALGLIWEWWGLISAFATSGLSRAIWMLVGLIYIGTSTSKIVQLRGDGPDQIMIPLLLVLVVIATDVGAYFSGRTFGGPKIAPAISPSKTWSGLCGGMIGATLIAYLALRLDGASGREMIAPAVAPLFAIVAQIGDFFESWMKRKAGVKDSGALIPGHGGLLDRLDGLLMVLFFVRVTQ